MILKQWFSGWMLFVILLFLATPGQGWSGQQPQVETDVATGESAPRAYFDVNVGEGRMLEVRLMLINKTFDQIVESGGQPQFVVGVRGGASLFVTKGDGHVSRADLAYKKKIHHWLEIFQKKGIRLEQCNIAAGFFGIDRNDFRPEMTVVANGYLAMITYQNRGFAQVPMD